jgi:endoglucanase
VSDRESAADADVLAAYALLRHSGPESAELHRAGARLAASVLRSEAVALPGGAPIPVAGPWAKRKPEPVVNPSYLMPGVFAALSRLTGEASWSSAARAAVDLVSALTRQGRRLPPDWARLRGARLVAAFKPGGRRQVRFGLDAARLPIWFAGAHGDAARRLAASWWEHVLSSKRDHLEASALALFGAVIDERPSPVGLLAGAAAAGAAGDLAAAGALRRRARELGAAAPTYYGDAWAALAPALLGGRM